MAKPSPLRTFPLLDLVVFSFLLLFSIVPTAKCDCPYFRHERSSHSANVLNTQNSDRHHHYQYQHHRNDVIQSEGFPPSEIMDAYGAALAKLDWDEIRSDLRDLFHNNNTTNDKDERYWPADYGHYGGLFVRLAWHCSGSYRRSDGRGGCDGGNQRFEPERSWADNTNLDKARRLLEPIRLKHGIGLSHGDLYILAGTESIRDMGGPILGFCGGRIDSIDGSQTRLLGPTEVQRDKFAPCGGKGDGDCQAPLGQNTMGLIYVNPEGPFGVPDPMGAADTIRDVFGRMTMTDRENVALIGGGHTFGKTHGACPDGAGPSPAENEDNPYPGMCGATGKGEDAFTSGFEGPWTSRPTMWDNEYMKNLLDYEWEAHVGPGGKHQWRVVNNKGGSRPRAPKAHGNGTTDIMMLTTDIALVMDPIYRTYVEEFATDIDSFSKAFAEVWYKLTSRDMGPYGRCAGQDIPPPQPFQNQLPDPAPEGKTIDWSLVEEVLHDLIATDHDGNDGTVGEFLRLSWQCASTFRITDYLGGCNGARIRFIPGRDWTPNAGLDRTLQLLKSVKESFGVGLSWADLIVMAGNVNFIRLAGDNNDNLPILTFCPGRTDALDGMGWDNLAFGNDVFPTSIEDMLELNSRRGFSAQEFVALSWPTHYTSRPLNTDYLHDILTGVGVGDNNSDDDKGSANHNVCGDVLTCGLSNHPELRVWVEYYVSVGSDIFALDVVAVWTKMMNADRFDGPTGNLCNRRNIVSEPGSIYRMGIGSGSNEDEDGWRIKSNPINNDDGSSIHVTFIVGAVVLCVAFRWVFGHSHFKKRLAFSPLSSSSLATAS